MNAGRIVAIASAFLALVSLIIAFVECEGIMTVTAVFVLGFGAIASKRCSARTNRYILLASMMTLICTVLSVTVFSQQKVDDGEISEFVWFYIMAVIHAVPIVPLTFSSFVIIASVSEASYNWAVVRGLSPFISMGMLVPGYVAEYFFQDFYVDVWMVDNGYILYGLIVMFVIMLVVGLVVTHYMRVTRTIITEKGSEVLQ